MSNNKQKSNKIKSLAQAGLWLLEVAFRSIAGYILVTNYNNVFVIAAGVYGLTTAGMIVVVHFVKSNAK